MAYQVTITARYPRDADMVFAEACQFSEMVDAMRGIARYEGLPDDEAREGETYVVDVTLFGLMKNPGHTMHVERLDPAARIIQSREHNRSVRQWDHTLSVQPEGTGGCVWQDLVIVDAAGGGWFSARFAAFVYRRRHRHRGALSIRREIRRA